MLLPNRHSLASRLVLMLAAISAFVLAYQWGNSVQRRHAGPPQIQGVLISPPAPAPDFHLRDSSGQEFDREDLAAGWTLLAFGDLRQASGQLAVQRLIDVYNRVADQRSLREDLRLVLVSPASADDPRGLALARDFTRITPALRVVVAEPDGTDTLSNTFGPSATGAHPAEPTPSIHVFTSGGQLIAVLPGELDGAAMAEDLRSLHDQWPNLLPEAT